MEIKHTIMNFNYKQLTFVREYRGYSQTELASKIPGLSQSNLSKFEKGLGILSADVVKRIIDFLGFPEEFYNVKIGNNVDNAHYRRRSGISKKDRCHIDYSNKIIGYLVDEMSDSIEFPEMNLRFIDLEEGYTPESAAKFTRRYMGIPDSEPVKDICTLLEKYGVIIVEKDYDEDIFDGVSFTTDKGAFVLVLNKNFSNDHKRLTIAHELGHIIMHLSPNYPIPDYRDKENEAFRFAAEFLMPSESIKPSLRNLRLNYLAPLKEYWLTSMASIIRRAKELACIDENKYKYFYIELSRRGYTKHEPINVEIDEPSVFYEAYSLFKTELGYTMNDLSRAFKLPIDIIQDFCEKDKKMFRLKIVR